MFVWARIPDRYADCYALSDGILHGANVFITPGGIFGTAGDRFIRVSLCSREERIREARERIAAWKALDVSRNIS
jgi:aspartate/methionine/tyrosine aminotransferase